MSALVNHLSIHLGEHDVQVSWAMRYGEAINPKRPETASFTRNYSCTFPREHKSRLPVAPLPLRMDP